MGEVILEKGEVLKVYSVFATAVQSQLFSFADLFLKKGPLKMYGEIFILSIFNAVLFHERKRWSVCAIVQDANRGLCASASDQISALILMLDPI